MRSKGIELVAQFEHAVREHAWLRIKEPSQFHLIEGDYKRAKIDLLEFINKMEGAGECKKERG